MKKRLKDQRGLTLVELLAVIVILGIIAAIAVPSIGGIIQKSKEDALKADAIAVLNAAKMHISSTNLTPDTSGGDTITMDDSILTDYLDNSQYFKNDGVDTSSAYKVEYSINAQTFKLTTTAGITAGKSTITFTSAELKDINNDKEKGTRTIPKPAKTS